MQKVKSCGTQRLNPGLRKSLIESDQSIHSKVLVQYRVLCKKNVLHYAKLPPTLVMVKNCFKVEATK